MRGNLPDMAGSARGHGIFDLQALFASLVALEKKNPFSGF